MRIVLIIYASQIFAIFFHEQPKDKKKMLYLQQVKFRIRIGRTKLNYDLCYFLLSTTKNLTVFKFLLESKNITGWFLL